MPITGKQLIDAAVDRASAGEGPVRPNSRSLEPLSSAIVHHTLGDMSTSISDCPHRERDDHGADMLPTPPSTHTSRSTSPTSPLPDSTIDGADIPEAAGQAKKKKKKKTKKSAKAKDQSAAGKGTPADGRDEEHDRPPVLCISRNKHWRYISSYHVRFYHASCYFIQTEARLERRYRALGCSSPSSFSSRSSCSILTRQPSRRLIPSFLHCCLPLPRPPRILL